MPKLADHDERRRTITTACRKLIAVAGLEAATFQSVAAEAGVSVRLVQYYFGNKRQLLLATHQATVDDAIAMLEVYWTQCWDDLAPREVLRKALADCLPLDDQRRSDAIVLAAFRTAGLTDSRGYAVSADVSDMVRSVVDCQVERLNQLSPTGRKLKRVCESDLIIAGIAGLTERLLTGQMTAQRAVQLVDLLLARTMGSS